jgi:hypothetical protein
MEGSMGKKKKGTNEIIKFIQDINRYNKNYISSVAD